MQILEDRTTPGCVYYGMTPKFATQTSEAQWQIQRTTFDGTNIIVLFADSGKYNNVWDDRANYFPPCPASTVPLPGSVDTNTVINPSIETIDLPSGGTEYTYTPPSGTKRFIMKNTGNKLVNVAVIQGEIVNVWPIDPGGNYGESELGAEPTFYLRSASNNQKLVVFSWS